MNKTILITGGAQRIGKEIALFFAQRGWNIAIHFNKSHKQATLLKKQIIKMKVKCCTIKADLSKENETKSIIKKTNQTLGIINCLINCASIFEHDEIDDFNSKMWNSHFDINLKAPAILASYFAKQKKINNANIINIVDQRVLKLTPYFLSYTLSKSALQILTKTLAMKFAPRIRVNAIAPGPVLKNYRQSKSHFRKQFQNTLLKKQVKIKDICNSVEFIINNSSITGLTIPVDSGQNLGWRTPDLIKIKE